MTSGETKTSPEAPRVQEGGEQPPFQQQARNAVNLKFQVPRGKVSNLMGVMNLLQSKFETLEVSLNARDGSITEQDYEEKIQETFTQLGIKMETANR